MEARERLAAVRALRRTRPKSRLLRRSAWGLAALALASWLSGEIRPGEMLTERRRANLVRFLSEEARPRPLREGGSWSDLAAWVGEVWDSVGREATLATFWISVAAIVLAGIFALGVAPLCSRSLATREPFLLGGGPRGRGWWAASGLARLGCIALRGVPEYVFAFFLMAILGGTAWPAVLALALHNGGILGRLYGDTVENLRAGPVRSLRMLGARRRQLYAFAVLPMALPRFLLYFFYRFETCVREATVLGMLGVISLGYYIRDARARLAYDEMLLLVAFGVGIVLAGDLASYAARGWVRKAR